MFTDKMHEVIISSILSNNIMLGHQKKEEEKSSYAVLNSGLVCKMLMGISVMQILNYDELRIIWNLGK